MSQIRRRCGSIRSSGTKEQQIARSIKSKNDSDSVEVLRPLQISRSPSEFMMSLSDDRHQTEWSKGRKKKKKKKKLLRKNKRIMGKIQTYGVIDSVEVVEERDRLFCLFFLEFFFLQISTRFRRVNLNPTNRSRSCPHKRKSDVPFSSDFFRKCRLTRAVRGRGGHTIRIVRVLFFFTKVTKRRVCKMPAMRGRTKRWVGL